MCLHRLDILNPPGFVSTIPSSIVHPGRYNNPIPALTTDEVVEPEAVFSGQLASVNTANNQQVLSPSRDQDKSSTAISAPKSLRCTLPGCPTKPFNRRFELERHMRKHNPHATYECMAIGCNRVGNKGFY